MSAPPSQYREQASAYTKDDWDEQGEISTHSRGEVSQSLGWTITVLGLVALGVWAWYSYGPDLKRYLRIRSM